MGSLLRGWLLSLKRPAVLRKDANCVVPNAGKKRAVSAPRIIADP